MLEGIALIQEIECLLFVASEPLAEKRLAEICGVEPYQIREALAELAVTYETRGFQLRQVAGGWQFATQAEFAPLIEKLYRPKVQQLSRAAMETLAIIAYRQPIARAEIAAIRQVDVDAVVSTLLDKRLIKEVGRRIGPGRAMLYGTTEEFLSFFGLNTLEDLPDPARGLSEPEQREGEITLFPNTPAAEAGPSGAEMESE